MTHRNVLELTQEEKEREAVRERLNRKRAEIRQRHELERVQDVKEEKKRDAQIALIKQEQKRQDEELAELEKNLPAMFAALANLKTEQNVPAQQQEHNSKARAELAFTNSMQKTAHSIGQPITTGSSKGLKSTK